MGLVHLKYKTEPNSDNNQIHFLCSIGLKVIYFVVQPRKSDVISFVSSRGTKHIKILIFVPIINNYVGK